MPHSKGWRSRKDERTLRETPIFARGVPIGQLASDWVSIVGPRLAAASSPVSLDGGILVVATSDGPWGAQVRFLADEIRKKANVSLGSEQVRRVQVVVRPDLPKPL